MSAGERALEGGATDSAPTLRAAYANRTAVLMAAFCEFAYLPFEAVDGSGRTALRAALGPDFDNLTTFDVGGTQAYLAVGRNLAVLAFRGTQDSIDWRTNLNAARVPMPSRNDVLVHAGFSAAFQCCSDEIRAALDAPELAKVALYITGHSLGGALAQIASAAFERDTLAACYTFGSPRVGTSTFDVLVKCPHYRVVNSWDGVPGVPVPLPWGFKHGGDPRLIRGAPPVLFRRDRLGLARFGIDLMAVVQAVFSRTYFPVADHSISTYRDRLSEIARAAL